jgi:translation initiation factor eIF-2B subunit delta
MLDEALISDKIKQIKFDHLNGSSQIARDALNLLKLFVNTSKTTTCTKFKEDFKEIGICLLNARPNMAPVQNLVAQVVYEVNSRKEIDLVSLKNFTMSLLSTLIKQSEISIQETAKQATVIIPDSGCLATCSYSSTVCESLRKAKKQGKQFKVVVAESRVGTTSYGMLLAHSLEKLNIAVKVFRDNQILKYVQDVKCVLVGVDSLLYDGSIINGSPTGELAVAAKQLKVPFYSVCETTKANILSYLGKKIKLMRGFDVVSSNLITGIITEKGLLNSDKLAELMKEKSVFFKILDINSH